MNEEIVLKKDKIICKDNCFYIEGKQVKFSDIKLAGIAKVSNLDVEDIEFVTNDDFYFFISSDMDNYEKVKEIVKNNIELCDLFEYDNEDTQLNSEKLIVGKEDDTNEYHTLYIAQENDALIPVVFYITIDGTKTYKLYRLVNMLELKNTNHHIKIWTIIKRKVKVLFNDNIEMNEDKFSYISIDLLKDYKFKITDFKSLEKLKKKARGDFLLKLFILFLILMFGLAIIVGVIILITS